MGEPKPLASLSGLLLARKGAARPAMRRPATLGNLDDAATNQDDLGWNDMGYDVNPDQNTPMDYDHTQYGNPLARAVPEANPVVRQQQEMIAQRLQAQAEVGFDSLPVAALHADAPQIAVEIEEAPRNVSELLSQKVAPVQVTQAAVQAPPPVSVTAPASVVPPAVKASVAAAQRAAPGSKGKAAFTLRLDKDRHLQLRLACAVSNRSAQMIVTDALDAFLNNMPEIGQLAASVPSK